MRIGRDQEELGMDHTEAAPEQPLVFEDQMPLDRETLELGQQSVPGRQSELGQEPTSVQEPAPAQEPAAGQGSVLEDPVTEPEPEPVPDYPDPPRTGDTAVDQVLDAVARAVGGPLEEQLAVYDTAHRTLQDRLADVEG
jgi:hypothetical protein